MSAPVLLVVPTLGRRLDFLQQTLDSIAAQDVAADVVLVTPRDATAARDLAAERGARVVDDPGSLPAAVNVGVATAGPDHRYVNWIGDDDLLAPGSLASTTRALSADPGRVVAYGACAYIDDQGRHLWTSQAGRWAQRILPWGPDLIPQPGMLVRLDAWQAVGGVDASLRFAFDLDLLLKVSVAVLPLALVLVLVLVAARIGVDHAPAQNLDQAVVHGKAPPPGGWLAAGGPWLMATGCSGRRNRQSAR